LEEIVSRVRIVAVSIVFFLLIIIVDLL